MKKMLLTAFAALLVAVHAVQTRKVHKEARRTKD